MELNFLFYYSLKTGFVLLKQAEFIFIVFFYRTLNSHKMNKTSAITSSIWISPPNPNPSSKKRTAHKISMRTMTSQNRLNPSSTVGSCFIIFGRKKLLLVFLTGASVVLGSYLINCLGL